MSRSLLLVLSAALVVSCAQAPPAGETGRSGDLDLTELFPVQSVQRGGGLEITARVRLSLPKYRIRGACGIFAAENGSAQIDFVHSSIFGSYREDATIFVEGDTMMIRDNERDLLWGPEEALSLVSEHFEFAFLPEDVIVFLLLGVPRKTDIDGAETRVSGDEWSLTAEWKGRSIEIDGVRGLGPVRFRICTIDGTGCYEARYGYGSGGGLAGYPDKIVCERIGGSERLSIYVESARYRPLKNIEDQEQDVSKGVINR